MAVTLTLVSRSSTLLKYSLRSTGNQTGTVTAAGSTTPDLLTDSIQGPLHDLLATSVASQSAARALAFERSDLVITILPRDSDANWTIDATNSTTALQLSLTSAATDSVGSILDIEYKHSIVR